MKSLKAGPLSCSFSYSQNLSCCLAYRSYSTDTCWLIVNIHSLLAKKMITNDYIIISALVFSGTGVGEELKTSRANLIRNWNSPSCKYEIMGFVIRPRITAFWELEFLPEVNCKASYVRSCITVTGSSLMPWYMLLGAVLELQWVATFGNDQKQTFIILNQQPAGQERKIVYG